MTINIKIFIRSLVSKDVRHKFRLALHDVNIHDISRSLESKREEESRQSLIELVNH